MKALLLSSVQSLILVSSGCLTKMIKQLNVSKCKNSWFYLILLSVDCNSMSQGLSVCAKIFAQLQYFNQWVLRTKRHQLWHRPPYWIESFVSMTTNAGLKLCFRLQLIFFLQQLISKFPLAFISNLLTQARQLPNVGISYTCKHTCGQFPVSGVNSWSDPIN